jgi:hypothetical protein
MLSLMPGMRVCGIRRPQHPRSARMHQEVTVFRRRFDPRCRKFRQQREHHRYSARQDRNEGGYFGCSLNLVININGDDALRTMAGTRAGSSRRPVGGIIGVTGG